MKHLKTRQELNEASENLNISDVSDSKIIVGNKYTVEEYDTKVVVIEIDDDRKKAFVTADLVDKTGGFWINYSKLK
jgi:hypothetical protein